MQKPPTFDLIELPTNPNLPPWLITPKEEKAIFERWKKKTFKTCDDVIAPYVKCSNTYKNPMEAMKACAEVHQKMLACISKYQKQKYLDVEREIWIEEKLEKRRLHKQQLLDQHAKEEESK